MIVYVSIGNSDDKLSQREWSDFWHAVDELVYDYSDQFHGRWQSRTTDAWQNAVWCVEFNPTRTQAVIDLQQQLAHLAHIYQQDSISWAQVQTQRFIAPEEKTDD